MIKREIKIFNKIKSMGLFFFGFVVLIVFLVLIFLFLIKFIIGFLSSRFSILIVLFSLVIIGILALLILLRASWYSFGFLMDKDVFTGKEFHKLRKRKDFYKKESSYKGTIGWAAFLPFFSFSLFFSVFINANSIWFYKRMRYIRRKAVKYEKGGYSCMFLWRKVLDIKKKDYDYYIYVLPCKNKKKI